MSHCSSHGEYHDSWGCPRCRDREDQELAFRTIEELRQEDSLRNQDRIAGNQAELIRLLRKIAGEPDPPPQALPPPPSSSQISIQREYVPARSRGNYRKPRTTHHFNPFVFLILIGGVFAIFWVDRAIDKAKKKSPETSQVVAYSANEVVEAPAADRAAQKPQPIKEYPYPHIGDAINLNEMLARVPAGADPGFFVLWEGEMSPGDISPWFYRHDMFCRSKDEDSSEGSQSVEERNSNTFRILAHGTYKRKFMIIGISAENFERLQNPWR